MFLSEKKIKQKMKVIIKASNYKEKEKKLKKRRINL